MLYDQDGFLHSEKVGHQKAAESKSKAGKKEPSERFYAGLSPNS
jgi:hypothetical protein